MILHHITLYNIISYRTGEKLSMKQLTEIMKSMDENFNGTISFDEFVKGMYTYVLTSTTISERKYVHKYTCTHARTYMRTEQLTMSTKFEMKRTIPLTQILPSNEIMKSTNDIDHI